MKILHVLAQLPEGTGSGIYFTNLVKELEKYGHEQRAVFALQDKRTWDVLPGGSQYPLRFKTDALPFPVPGMSDAMPYDSTRYRDMTPPMLERWRRAFRELLEKAGRDFQPDALVLHHLWMLTSLALEVFPNTKSLGLCHYTDLRQARQNPLLLKAHVKNIHRLEAILTLTDAHQAEIREIHRCQETKIVTVGGGFDGALFFPKEEKERPNETVKILYAGKIDPSKGIFALLEAFAALRKQDGNISLTVVGAPTLQYAEQFEKLTRKAEGVNLSPPVPQAELARLMREHDIFAMPSFFEGLGLIAIEALASGLWTVAAEIEGLMSLLGEEVMRSGVIEFVPPPEMEAPGVPGPSRLPAFVDELAERLSLQAARARSGQGFPEGLPQKIAHHSWKAIAAKINELL